MAGSAEASLFAFIGRFRSLIGNFPIVIRYLNPQFIIGCDSLWSLRRPVGRRYFLFSWSRLARFL